MLRTAPARAYASPLMFVIVLTLVAGCDNAQTDDSGVPEFEQLQGTPTAAQLAALEANTTLVSGIRTPNANGTFDDSLKSIFQQSFVSPGGYGYAFELGQENTAFSAFAGVLPGVDPGPLPPSGAADMVGTYNVAEVGKSDGELRGFGEPQLTSGQITLRADFLFKTLRGNDSFLDISGVFNGNTLTGTASFDKRAATLEGQIGSNHAVGVFHGSDDATTYIGGFVVER